MGCYRAFRDLDAMMVEVKLPSVPRKAGSPRSNTEVLDSTKQGSFPQAAHAELRDKSQDPGARPMLRMTVWATSVSTATSAASSTAQPRNGDTRHDGLRRRTSLIWAAAPRPSASPVVQGGPTASRSVKAILVNVFAGIKHYGLGLPSCRRRRRRNSRSRCRSSSFVSLAPNVEEGADHRRRRGLTVITAKALAPTLQSRRSKRPKTLVRRRTQWQSLSMQRDADPDPSFTGRMAAFHAQE